jgi:hypothetical protein
MTVHAARIRRVLRHLNVVDLGKYWSVVLASYTIEIS